ncbi:MAG: tetratricopeptide repeat protein, partial [Ferruginibacter sp.]|nr:tetratricopeptide repeat protein [Ferruginibacter sp.]
FKMVETQEEYKGVVPYYIAEIYYFQGRKDEALEYGKNLLESGKQIYYDKNLNLLLGQLYFERNNFTAALPLIENYVQSGEPITKDIQYQLSYCYFKTNKVSNAIEGFKNLSSEKDSLGQNSMYLLGSLYLKNNEKSNARNAFQYCAYNNSNPTQQKISRFNYAKLSYELGFQDIATKELKQYLADYSNSEYDTEAKEILVNILAGTSNYNEGLSIYSSFLNPTPMVQKAYPRLLYGRAIELINDQQLDAADDLLQTLINSPYAEKLLPYAHFYRGEIAARQERYDEAVTHFDYFVKSNAQSQGEANMNAARYNLAYTYLQLEDYKNALVNFENLSKSVTTSSTPLQQEAYIRSADCYFMLKDFSKAASMYDAVAAGAFPQSDYALYQKAIIAGIKNNNEKIKLLNLLLNKYPSTALKNLTHMEIAESFIDDEKASEAIPYLKKILAADNAESILPKAYLKIGLAYFNINDDKNALNYYRQLLDKYPNSEETEEAILTIKDIYVGMGKPEEYVNLMRSKGITVSVNEADSLSYSAANMKYESGDNNLAIEGLNSYLSQFANGAYALDVNYKLGLCYQKKKDWPAVLRCFGVVHESGLNKYYEAATLELARINYFEIKDYSASKKYFDLLKANAADPKIRIEALRGLVRSYYQLKEYAEANDAAKQLLQEKSVGTDDKLISSLVLGKSQQIKGDYTAAINLFKTVSSANKTSWGAEARYETASCHFSSGNLTAAEKSAMSVIKETGSYDYWVTKSYILIGDIFMKQKDYFNAKATYESVAKNAVIVELKEEASKKYQEALIAEKK